MTDAALMQAVARGDERAVEQLYDRFAALVRYRARAAGLSREDQNDMVQTVMVNLWRKAGSYDAERCPLTGFVRMVARRAVIDAIRQKTRGVPAGRWGEDYDPAAMPERQPAEMPDLSGLSEANRDVLMHIARGAKLRVVAEIMGKPIGTIKSMSSRACAMVRGELPESNTVYKRVSARRYWRKRAAMEERAA